MISLNLWAYGQITSGDGLNSTSNLRQAYARVKRSVNHHGGIIGLDSNKQRSAQQTLNSERCKHLQTSRSLKNSFVHSASCSVMLLPV